MEQQTKKITREEVLEAMLKTMTKEEFLGYFTLPVREEVARYGQTAFTDQSSIIRQLLEGLAHGVSKQLNDLRGLK